MSSSATEAAGAPAHQEGALADPDGPEAAFADLLLRAGQQQLLLQLPLAGCEGAQGPQGAPDGRNASMDSVRGPHLISSIRIAFGLVLCSSLLPPLCLSPSLYLRGASGTAGPCHRFIFLSASDAFVFCSLCWT